VSRVASRSRSCARSSASVGSLRPAARRRGWLGLGQRQALDGLAPAGLPPLPAAPILPPSGRQQRWRLGEPAVDAGKAIELGARGVDAHHGWPGGGVHRTRRDLPKRALDRRCLICEGFGKRQDGGFSDGLEVAASPSPCLPDPHEAQPRAAPGASAMRGRPSRRLNRWCL
jgi:hypothetical protein